MFLLLIVLISSLSLSSLQFINSYDHNILNILLKTILTLDNDTARQLYAYVFPLKKINFNEFENSFLLFSSDNRPDISIAQGTEIKLEFDIKITESSVVSILLFFKAV